MKKITLLLTAVALTLATAQADSWGFSLGNGVGFYYGNNSQRSAPVYRAPAYVAPAPVYYTRPVTYYQPQTVYMQPYYKAHSRPVYYSEPVIYRESYRHCGSRQNVIYPNRW
jgi:hypothetical protein